MFVYTLLFKVHTEYCSGFDTKTVEWWVTKCNFLFRHKALNNICVLVYNINIDYFPFTLAVIVHVRILNK